MIYKQFFIINGKARIFVGGLFFLFIISVPTVFAENDLNKMATGIEVTIQSMTETSITFKAATYTVSPKARIFDQDGKKIKIWELFPPCEAKIIAEATDGAKIPIVMEIKLIKSLSNPDIWQNRILQYPE